MRVEVIGQLVYVRSAPGGDVLGTLARGAKINVSATSPDRAWLHFLYWGRPAWITASTNFIRAYGDLSRLPTAGGAVTVQGYSVLPNVPEPGQPFIIRISVQADQEVGAFQIASTCAGFAMLSVPRLTPGAAQAVDLQCPGDSATGAHTVDLIVDSDQQVSQGSKQAITYFIDRLYAQSAMLWPAYADLNLDGGVYDLAWDGNQILARNGTRLFVLPDSSLATIHYDRLLASEMVVEAAPLGVLGVVSGAGNRGAIQVIAREPGGLRIAFRIYQEAPVVE